MEVFIFLSLGELCYFENRLLLSSPLPPSWFVLPLAVDAAGETLTPPVVYAV